MRSVIVLLLLIAGCAVEGRNLNEEELAVLHQEIQIWNASLPYCDSSCVAEMEAVRIVYVDEIQCDSRTALACYKSGSLRYPIIHVLHSVASSELARTALAHEFAHGLSEITIGSQDPDHEISAIWIDLMANFNGAAIPDSYSPGDK